MAKKNTIHPAEQYAEDVRSGKVVACHWVQMAVERYYRDLDNAVEKGWYFSRQHAERVINFIERLKHVKGELAGQYLKLEPWQMFIIWVLFGFLMADTGKRRFLEAYVEVARKNGKSTLAVGIALYMEFADREMGAEVYSVATTRDQAKICFNYAQLMVQHSDLRNYGLVTRDAIAFERMGCTYKPLSSDAKNLDGLHAHCVVCDEYHAHKTSAVYDVSKTAMGARTQPLMFVITTAGLDTSVPCFAHRKSLTEVLDGIVEADRTFAIIFTLDDVAEVDDENMWVKANPCLGKSLGVAWLRDQYKTMRRDPLQEANIMTKSFNVWMDAPEVWIPDKMWSEIDSVVPMEELVGCRCIGALDLAAVNDYTAFCLLFNERGRWQMLWRFWVPDSKVADRAALQRENANITCWIKDGYITVTEGNVTDYERVLADIEQLRAMYNIEVIAYDPWNSSAVATKLVERGAHLEPFTQTISNYAPPTKEFERLVGLGAVDHYDNPVARWMLSNVVLRTDVNGNRRPDKTKSSEKIDGIVAAIMALGQWMSDNGDGGNVYERRGLLGFDDDEDSDNGNNDNYLRYDEDDY